MKYNSDELAIALKWYHSNNVTSSQRYAIRKAMKSLDSLRMDGTMVLIATYRMWCRMMADTIPAR